MRSSLHLPQENRSGHGSARLPRLPRLHEFLLLLRRAGESWLSDNAPSMGAALAFYSAFALAPLLLILSAVAGLVFGAMQARHALLGEARG
ncbi:MAG TPA: hypothetical protein VMD56_08300, partial [Steroidobacteraceae bacterium]|nr:hypothetical protein [Steroidobacteraceae bacterium]